MNCPKCGSQNPRVFSAEMGLATADYEAVYALYRPSVCLECGFAEGVVSEETLADLRIGGRRRILGASPKAGQTDTPVLARAAIMAANCPNAGSRKLRAYNTEIAFGRGTLPPVHIAENPVVTVCLDCGRTEFVLPEAQVAELHRGIPSQPPQRVPTTHLKRSKSA